MTWDGGNQLTYPIKYHSIGYREDDAERPANSTGFEVASPKDPGIQISQLQMAQQARENEEEML